MTLVLIIIGWIICGVIGAGIWVAYFQREYPSLASGDYRADLIIALGVGLLGGPLDIVVGLLMSGFCKHGWTLRPPK